MKILCASGWACGEWLWERHTERLSALLPDTDIEVTCLAAYEEAGSVESHFDLAIGHSLGLLWLLDADQLSFDRVVSIAGFTRFVSGDDFSASPDPDIAIQDDDDFHAHIARADSGPVGWPDRVLERMERGLAIDSANVLADFFENAGAADSASQATSNANVKTLERGLAALRNTDCREQWSLFAGPQRVIAATDDRIVTAAHTRACFPECEIQWLKTDCHLLPLRFPEICAALIREVLEQA